MKQKEVSDILGLAQNAYSLIETNHGKKIDDELLTRIAKLFGVSIEDIKSPTLVVLSLRGGLMDRQNEELLISIKNKDKLLDELASEMKFKNKRINAVEEELKEWRKGNGQ